MENKKIKSLRLRLWKMCPNIDFKIMLKKMVYKLSIKNLQQNTKCFCLTTKKLMSLWQN